MNFNGNFYSNIVDPTSAVVLGGPIILAIDSQSTTDPVYIDISCLQPAMEIKNLEMCKFNISDDSLTNVIDLQPFLEAFFKHEPEFMTSIPDWLIKVTVKAHTANENDLYMTIHVLNNTNKRGKSPVVAYPSTWAVQAAGKPTGVYNSEIAANDFSDLFLPEGQTVLFLQPTYAFEAVGGYTVTVKQNLVTIYSSTETVDVTKYITQSPWTLVMGTRNIVRQHFCLRKTPIIAYQNKYNYFEYLCFSDVYSVSTEVNRNERIKKPFDNFKMLDRSSWNGGDYTTTYTLNITPNSNSLIEKLNDLAVSKKVYLGKNIVQKDIYSLANETAWTEVDLEYTPTFNSKYGIDHSQRQTVVVKTKENIF